MNGNAVSESSAKTKWKEYRDKHQQRKKDFYANIAKWRENFQSIQDVIIVPDNVDMKSFCGTEGELRFAIERLYANDGRDLDPTQYYPPGLLSKFGKDFELHAQGIYYRNHFSEDLVVCNRKVWAPSLPEDEPETPEIRERKARAQIFATHAKNNESWCKSEYSWEADAWSDVFGPIRDDPCLAIDKHDYVTLVPDTDPVLCTLTGTSTFVKRTPDATFGLATFTDQDAYLPTWSEDLHSDRLQHLLLHPKYGLFSDPGRIETDLAFPFMVYEAKGWSGDCRAARRQACSGAAFYLDMLDELARQPAPVGSPRAYQTKASHQYQIFVLTSFGAYWHLLVGYRRPRLATEHAGKNGMSETVYVFQRLWSGHVVHEEIAWELLSLIDQIHLWAITEYRTFVLEHLRPWHRLCQENYLFEWDSMYDLGEHLKRKRVCHETEDLMAPSWVGHMNEPSRRTFQRRAKLSLAEAIEEHSLIKGKAPCRDEANREWTCLMSGCSAILGSDAAFLDHMRRAHVKEESQMAKLRWCIEERKIQETIRRRQESGIRATRHWWPGYSKRHRSPEQDEQIKDPGLDGRSKRIKVS